MCSYYVYELGMYEWMKCMYGCMYVCMYVAYMYGLGYFVK